MALLIKMDCFLENILKTHLLFDDKREKFIELKIGNRYTLEYNDLGIYHIVSGKLINIIPSKRLSNTHAPVNEEREEFKKFILVLDCSDQYESNIVRVDSGNIRDIYIEDQCGQNGIKIRLDEYLLKNSLITDERAIYRSNNSQFVIEQDTTNIDPAELYHLLTSKNYYRGFNDGVYYTIDLDMTDNTDYLNADYIIQRVSYNDSIVLENIFSDIEKDKKILKVPVFGFNVYYREDIISNEWKLLSIPSITLQEALSDTLGINSIEELIDSYKKLYKFEPLLHNRHQNMEFCFMHNTGHSYADSNDICIGKEAFQIIYNKADLPTWFDQIDSIELNIDETYQLNILTDSEMAYEIGYNSSDETIATVDNTGLVTGISSGETFIDYYSKDLTSVGGRVKVIVY